MIEKIESQNFQCHKKLRLELDKITTIIGPSDRGKTALLRLIKWVCLNEPNGDDFISHGEEECKASLIIDSRRVTRKKSKLENAYYLGKDVFKSFRTSVPEEISEHIKVNDLNFQDQHKPPFWFFESAGKVSKELNSIVDLEIIDSTLASVVAKTKKARATFEVCEVRLEEARKERTKLKWIKQFDTQLTELENTNERLTTNQRRCTRLSEMLGNVETLSEGLEEAGRALQAARNACEEMEEGHARWIKVTKNIGSLRELLTQIKDLEQIVDTRPPNLSVLEKNMPSITQISNQREDLTSLLQDIIKTEYELCQNQENMQSLKEELSKVKSCPLCGNRM